MYFTYYISSYFECLLYDTLFYDIFRYQILIAYKLNQDHPLTLRQKSIQSDLALETKYTTNLIGNELL